MKTLHKKANFILGYVNKAYFIEDKGVIFSCFFFFLTFSIPARSQLERLSADRERKKVTNADEFFLVS